MTTGKALLIVGGVGVGGYMLYQLLKPGGAIARAPAPKSKTSAGGDNVFQGLASLVTSFTSSSGPAKYGTAATGQGATPTFWGTNAASDANYGNPYYVTTDAGSYTAGAYNNYNYADSHPGTALPDGVFGPPVPTDYLSSDGLMDPTSF